MSVHYEPGSEGLTGPNHHLNAALEAVAEVARKLKQERDEARADATALAERLTALELSSTSELARLERERDEARELNAKLFALADRAIDDLRWFYESHEDGISLELEKLKEAAK